jgi:hypothetical protein|tara:strand:- start:624 stop:899 length:276 start_codon:yes stop_codon:yes gene_type:complete
MTILSQESLKSILEYLEKSINNLAVDGIDNLEIEGGIEGIKNFLENQFDIRLENLLISKNSSIHHLESGMKNLVIQKKQEIIENILKQFNN